LSCYIDTSILAAYYCPEMISDQVQALLREVAKPAISPLTEVELFSSISRKIRTNELNKEDGTRILSKFLSHMETGLFEIIPIEMRHWRLARSWIGLFNTPLRTVDALHLAIASVEDLVLITLDQHMIRSAKILMVKIKTLLPD